MLGHLRKYVQLGKPSRTPQASSSCRRVLPQQEVVFMLGKEASSHPPVIPTKPSQGKEGEWEGWGGGRARSLLVNQSWLSRWSCSRGFDFSLPSPLCVTPQAQLHGFNSTLKKQWGLLSNPPSSSNSQQRLKLQERERGGGRGDPLPGGKGEKSGEKGGREGEAAAV